MRRPRSAWSNSWPYHGADRTADHRDPRDTQHHGEARRWYYGPAPVWERHTDLAMSHPAARLRRHGLEIGYIGSEWVCFPVRVRPAGQGGVFGRPRRISRWIRSRQLLGIGDVVRCQGSGRSIRSGRDESGVLRRRRAFITPVVPAGLRASSCGDSGSVLGRMCRGDSGRRGPFHADPGCLPGRPGPRLPGRLEQKRRSGHRLPFPGPRGPLTLAAPATPSDSTPSGSACSGSACSGSACSGSACSGSACSGSACTGSACSDVMAFGPTGSAKQVADSYVRNSPGLINMRT